MAHGFEERPAVVWVSPVAVQGERRLALSECPVSFIRGESVSFIEDFLAHVAAGGGTEPREWPARRVDAFSVIYTEMKKQEREEHGER